MRDIFDPKSGMSSTDNERFLRIWHEVSYNNIELFCNSSNDSLLSKTMVSIYKRWNKQKMVWKPRLHYKLEAQWKDIGSLFLKTLKKQLGGRIVNEDKFSSHLYHGRVYLVTNFPSAIILLDSYSLMQATDISPVHIHENILAF